MSALTARVMRTVVRTVALTLLAAGGITSGVLHLQARAGLDQALLAAAQAEAHPWHDPPLSEAALASPVQVRPWSAEDPRVPEALVKQALADAQAVWWSRGGARVLLLPVGPDALTGAEHDPFVVVAEAPAVRLADVVLPFLGTYLVVAAAVTLLAGVLVRREVARDLTPLRTAADGLEAVQGLGSVARVPPTGAEEVDRLLDSANALLQRLEVAFDAQASFTAHAAHELRTPLTIVLGELELALRRERTPEAYREALATSLAQTRRLHELVEGLMLLARVDAGQADRGRAPEHLSEIVRRALVAEGSTLEAAGCAVEVIAEGDPEVDVHLALVVAAVGNLLRNAARHAPGRPVTVSHGAVGRGGWVRVRDHGPGLDASACDAMMERFPRADGRREGLGLGLPLAREVARRHGGDLVLRPPGAGEGLVACLYVHSNEAPMEG